jgi:CheY-like chemotaxis protein/HPt (histidine-containing phosphotransfer) domain-containing protein
MQRLNGARILVAEDNPINQELARGLLECVGARVTTADNGKEAVERLLQEPFDCVLMDMQMPFMDGLQATRLIRANPALAALPILAMTANAGGKDHQRCLEAGMDDFMSKPILAASFYATLTKWLPPRSGAAPVNPTATAATPVSTWPVPSGNPNVVDLTILAQSVAGDIQKVRRYASLFAESIPQTVAELETTLARGDLPSLADLGHRLKSSSRMVGALGFADLCQSLEALRDQGTLSQADAIVKKMPLMLAEISADIDKALARETDLVPAESA